VTKDFPQSNDLLDAFKERVVQRKDRPSIEALASRKGPTGNVGPSGKSKKKVREGGNIDRTTRSHGTMLTAPPRHAPINIDSPPNDDFNQPFPPPAAETTLEVSMSPLSVL